MPTNGTAGVLRWRLIDERVVESLVVPLAVIVCYELGERPPQVPLTERDDAIQAFLFDGAYEPLRMRIAIGRHERCPNQPEASRSEEALDRGAPLPIAIADQHAIPAEDPINIVGQVAHRLDDERVITRDLDSRNTVCGLCWPPTRACTPVRSSICKLAGCYGRPRFSLMPIIARRGSMKIEGRPKFGLNRLSVARPSSAV